MLELPIHALCTVQSSQDAASPSGDPPTSYMKSSYYCSTVLFWDHLQTRQARANGMSDRTGRRQLVQPMQQLLAVAW